MRVGRPPLFSKLAVVVIVAFGVGGALIAYLTISTPADGSLPSQVTGVFVVDHFDGNLEVLWSPAIDDAGVAGYWVYRDGRKIGEGLSTTRSYTDHGLPIDIAFEYRVSAVDGAGNEGLRSAAVWADSAPSPPDITFGVWTQSGPTEWRLAVANVSRSIDLGRFQVTVVTNGSAILVPPTSVEGLPMTRNNVTLSFRDSSAEGRLDQGDGFVLGGIQPRVRYTLNLLYVPASRVLVASTVEA